MAGSPLALPGDDRLDSPGLGAVAPQNSGPPAAVIADLRLLKGLRQGGKTPRPHRTPDIGEAQRRVEHAQQYTAIERMAARDGAVAAGTIIVVGVQPGIDAQLHRHYASQRVNLLAGQRPAHAAFHGVCHRERARQADAGGQKGAVEISHHHRVGWADGAASTAPPSGCVSYFWVGGT